MRTWICRLIAALFVVASTTGEATAQGATSDVALDTTISIGGYLLGANAPQGIGGYVSGSHALATKPEFDIQFAEEAGVVYGGGSLLLGVFAGPRVIENRLDANAHAFAQVLAGAYLGPGVRFAIQPGVGVELGRASQSRLRLGGDWLLAPPHGQAWRLSMAVVFPLR